MNNRNTIPRALLAFAIFALFCAGIFAPRMENVAARPLAACPGGVIAEWTFNNITTPSTGSGTFAYGSGINQILPFPAGNPDLAVAFNNWSTVFDANEYVEFSIDTTARSEITISFDYRSTGTGPTFFDLQYSTDGTTFTSFVVIPLNNNSIFHNLAYDLSSITGINNNPNTKIRLYGYGATGTGNVRLDNVSISEICPTPTPTQTFTPSETLTASLTFTPSETFTPSQTNTPGTPPTSTRTSTRTRTPTVTRTLTPTATTIPNLTVLINEVAWMGTTASTGDEWIELYNPGATTIDLTGWQLKTTDESPSITWTSLDNVLIAPGGYYLLERTDDTTVSDILANKIYTGELVNGGETLRLFNNLGALVDVANSNGGAWPAGNETTKGSMERLGVVQDSDGSWVSNTGVVRNGLDANTNPINGTPGQSNWGVTITLTVSRTPTRTRTPTLTRTITRTPTPQKTATSVPLGRPVINEFLPRPGFDWNQDGNVDVFDEFIEIKNIGPVDMNLNGWRLDDEANLGSNPFTISNVTLKPGERIVFYGLETNILLSDGGDTVRLLNPSNRVYDSYTYKIAKVEDDSICRLVDGSGSWYEDCTPTPNFTNSRDGDVPSMPDGSGFESPVCNLPDTLPEAFFIAECRGYGANLWSAIYWDSRGWDGDRFVPENTSKWETFVE